jgi:hypothetical protein
MDPGHRRQSWYGQPEVRGVFRNRLRGRCCRTMCYVPVRVTGCVCYTVSACCWKKSSVARALSGPPTSEPRLLYLPHLPHITLSNFFRLQPPSYPLLASRYHGDGLSQTTGRGSIRLQFTHHRSSNDALTRRQCDRCRSRKVRDPRLNT